MTTQQGRTQASANAGAGLPLPLRVTDMIPTNDGSWLILIGPQQAAKWKNAPSEVQLTNPVFLRVQAETIDQYGLKIGEPITAVLEAANSS